MNQDWRPTTWWECITKVSPTLGVYWGPNGVTRTIDGVPADAREVHLVRLNWERITGATQNGVVWLR